MNKKRYEELAVRMNAHYDGLNAKDPVITYKGAIQFGEALNDAEFDKLLRGFIRHRKRDIVSEKEAAAFWMAYCDMKEVAG